MKLNLILHLIFCPIFLMACTTLDHGDQVLLVQSEPAGAEIFYRNKKQGVTPAYILMDRKYSGDELLLKHGAERKKVPLKTFYRWEDSFFSNLIFLTLAPVGWITDLATGSAFQYRQPKPQQFRNAKAPKKKTIELAFEVESDFPSLAIAPPQAQTEHESDAIGRNLEGYLKKKYPKTRIKLYSQSLEHFVDAGYDYDAKPEVKYQNRMRYNLGTDFIMESKVKKEKSGKYRVTGELKEVFSNKTEKQINIRLSPSRVFNKGELTFRKRFGKWFSLVPNTISVDVAPVSSQIQVGENVIEAVPVEADNFWEKTAEFVSNIGLTHVDRPTERKIWQWQFQFVSAVSASLQNVRYDELPPIEGVEYRRIFGGLGIGPQVGVRSFYGHIYLQVIPIWTYSEISYEVNGETERFKRGGIGAVTELGYSFFISNNIVGKIFARNTSEDQRLWAKAIEKTASQSFEFENVSYSYGGISIGYYFPGRNH